MMLLKLRTRERSLTDWWNDLVNKANEDGKGKVLMLKKMGRRGRHDLYKYSPDKPSNERD